MKNYKIKGSEVSFFFEVTSASDAVSGTWSGNALSYGTVIYPKASATNPMYKFEPSTIAVQASGNGVVDYGNNFTLVQNPATGFVGVKGTGITVGSKIMIQGFFVQDPTAADAVTGIEINTYTPPITNSKDRGNTVS
jgi:hypothetical protein